MNSLLFLLMYACVWERDCDYNTSEMRPKKELNA